jgi:hypothetical protein
MALILNGSDTSAGDDAGLGYTSAEGIIITGQGSTSDVTIKNDADATVLSIPTGTQTVQLHGTRITGDFSNATIANRVAFQTSTADASTIVNVITNGTGSFSGLRVFNNSSTTNASYGTFAASGSTAVEVKSERSGSGTYRPLDFYTSGSTRVRIDASGQTMIGTTGFNTGTGHSFHPDGYYYLRRASGAAQTMMLFYNDGNAVGEIRTSTTATQYLTSSDYRLKENVDYSWDATARLKQLKPARFNFISDPDVTVDGFIAHEAQEVVPHAVTGKKDAEEMQAIDQSKLVPLLVKAMQEQQTVIEALEARISTLEGS